MSNLRKGDRNCGMREKRFKAIGNAAFLPMVFSLLFLVTAPMQATTLFVTSADDAGVHTLRWAIQQANAMEGPDVISFRIPGPVPHVIRPQSPLPTLTDPAGVVIDGMTQPGALSGFKPPRTMSLRIIIDGTDAGETPGIWIVSSNNVIRGIVIVNFAEDGIRLQGTSDGTSWNYIAQNIIGLDVDGHKPMGNGRNYLSGSWAGIHFVIYSHLQGNICRNVVEENLISGNHADGVALRGRTGYSSRCNSIRKNYIGTDISGSVAVGNGKNGIHIDQGSRANTINGNLICGNEYSGVCITGDSQMKLGADSNLVMDNDIGIRLDGTALGNRLDGCSIGVEGTASASGFSRWNIILDNRIAWNHGNGIRIREHVSSRENADGNRITRNAIFNNDAHGFDLGNRPVAQKSVKAIRPGPNQYRDCPVILTAVFKDGITTIAGTALVRSCLKDNHVELFRMGTPRARLSNCDAFLGSVTPRENGNWVYVCNGKLGPGDVLVATLIDCKGNTSEFSRTVPVEQVGEAGMAQILTSKR